MWAFWLLLTAMIAAAVALVVAPLWRRSDPGPSRRDENVAIYRERVAELHADRDAGRVDAEQARALEDELGRRLLAEADSTADTGTPDRRRPWLVSLALLAAVPIAALSLYLPDGSWRLGGGELPELSYLAADLARRVESDPGDARAWRMLGRVRMWQGDNAAAAEALARGNELQASADSLVREAGARAMARGGTFAGRPTALLERALEIDPDHGKALWYAGVAAAAAGDAGAARRHWERLLSQPDLPQALREAIERRLNTLGNEPGQGD